MKVIFGREFWVFVFAYGLGSDRNETERETFWKYLDRLQFWSKCEYCVVRSKFSCQLKTWMVGTGYLGEMNIEKESCVKRELVVGNTLFKKGIHKYIWMRQDNGRAVDRAMMDCVVVLRNVIGRLLDVRVLKGEGGMSDHFLVEGKLKVGMRWMKTRRVGEAESSESE